jgi:hypothetical protein
MRFALALCKRRGTLPILPDEPLAQPREHALLFPAKRLTDVIGGRRGADGRAEMAITDCPVQLVVG